jgi:uncharacterized protein (TIGR02001 family)
MTFRTVLRFYVWYQTFAPEFSAGANAHAAARQHREFRLFPGTRNRRLLQGCHLSEVEMRSIVKSSALVLGLALPSVAAAQEISVSAGATLTSRYVSNGVEQTTGAAFQPWVEAEVNGFYAGLWASNTATSIVGSKYELDIYAGYRNEVGKLSYDFGYARYYYHEPYSNCCGEFILSMGYAVTDQLSLGTRFAFDPDTDVLNSRLTADFAVNDKIGLSASYGDIDHGGREYWTVGASYAITDTFSVSGTWHDSTTNPGIFVLSVDTSFSLR